MAVGQTPAITSAVIAQARAGVMAADRTGRVLISGLKAGPKAEICRQRGSRGQPAKQERAVVIATGNAVIGWEVTGPSGRSGWPAIRPSRILRWRIRPQWPPLLVAIQRMRGRTGSRRQVARTPSANFQHSAAMASWTTLRATAGVNGAKEVSAESAMAGAMTGAATAPTAWPHRPTAPTSQKPTLPMAM